LKDAAFQSSRWCAGLLIVFATSPSSPVFAQTVTVNVADGALRVHAPATGIGIIKGETLNRLKNGRSVRFDLELSVLPRSGGSPAVQSRQTFVLSYDLWEERFAVTQSGSPPRSVSHLSQSDAEAWCIQRVTVQTAGLGPLGRDLPIWIRLEYRVHDDERPSTADPDAGYSLRGLIERLSRRTAADALTGLIEAGPFRIKIEN
jgi:hypothetical protein